MQVDGVTGYDAATATAIMRNILLEAARRPPRRRSRRPRLPAPSRREADAPPKKPETRRSLNAPKSK